MASSKSNTLLDQFEQLKFSFGTSDAAKVENLLIRLRAREFVDPESLIRFHETLLFLRAYPHSARVVKLTEALLKTFPERIKKLKEAGIDSAALEHPEVSGIAGTSVTDTFTYNITRWLTSRYPSQVGFNWDWFESEYRLAETWPRFMPLLEEDALVEANVPYMSWLRAARDGERETVWVINQFERLPLSDKEKAELYDGLGLYLRWEPQYRATRTGMRLPVRGFFYHRKPLLQRRDVAFRAELEKPASPLKLVSPTQGRRILDMARQTSTLRYRELYGFTHGDERRVLHTNVGRGVDLFVFGVPPGRRLPLRAYHAAMIFKNGVPIGYFEGLSLFERMESGFNLYYTFRDGETAWLYAQTLNVFRQLLKVTTFSLDPYQIGHENEEGIESGAFWFYRKLGFRSTTPELIRLTGQEEEKITHRNSYRTSARVLRKLAKAPMILDLNKSQSGEWDRFSVRNIGLAVQRSMARRNGRTADKFRTESIRLVSAKLGIRPAGWNEIQLHVLSDFAVVLALIPDLNNWGKNEKESLVKIIRAKADRDEASYLILMQRHARLRREFIKIGSR